MLSNGTFISGIELRNDKIWASNLSLSKEVRVEGINEMSDAIRASYYTARLFLEKNCTNLTLLASNKLRKTFTYLQGGGPPSINRKNAFHYLKVVKQESEHIIS